MKASNNLDIKINDSIRIEEINNKIIDLYKEIKNLNVKLNKKEDDIKNIINEKDCMIQEIEKKLLKQQEINIQNNNEISKLNEKIEEKQKKIKALENRCDDLEYFVDRLEDIKKDKDEIIIIYETKEKGRCKIFGQKFVANNKYNIELFINGNKSELIEECILDEGINNVKMKIKNKITNLSGIFDGCKQLKDITGLKYLNTKYCTDFGYMLTGCSLLSDIKSLGKWNVSQDSNFSGMFLGCITRY